MHNCSANSKPGKRRISSTKANSHEISGALLGSLQCYRVHHSTMLQHHGSCLFFVGDSLPMFAFVSIWCFLPKHLAHQVVFDCISELELCRDVRMTKISATGGDEGARALCTDTFSDHKFALTFRELLLINHFQLLNIVQTFDTAAQFPRYHPRASTMASEEDQQIQNPITNKSDEADTVVDEYAERDRSIAFYDYSCTIPRLQRPPVRHFDFPILKAPSEIRNLIYKYWLAADPKDAMTNEEYNDDCEVRWNDDWMINHYNPNFFKPWQALERLDRCTSNGEIFHFHRTIFEREVPKLWSLNRQIRKEAMDIHFNRGMVLEMDADTREFPGMFERWTAKMSDKVLKGIRRLHVIVGCTLVAQAGEFSRKVQNTSSISRSESSHASCGCTVVQLGGSFTHSDALFKLELAEKNKVLSVRTFCQLMPFQEEAVKQAVRSYAQDRWC